MKTKFFSILLTVFIVGSVFSQGSINKYKYVIVPTKFDFLKEKDQYKLNSLTEFLFNKYGFEAVMEGSGYPKDLLLNNCLALKSDLINDSSMFKTKLKIELKDCNDKVIYTSAIGESREKEYKTSYNLALRDAFKSIEVLNYKYVPTESITSIVSSTTSEKSEVSQEIQQLREEIQSLKEEKISKPAVVVAAPIPVKTAVEVPVKKERSKEESVIEGVSNVLYAQAIDKGFQLVDSSPKVVYRIHNTNLNDIFLVEGKSAIIYKKGDDWVIEYYSDGALEHEMLNIKF